MRKTLLSFVVLAFAAADASTQESSIWSNQVRGHVDSG